MKKLPLCCLLFLVINASIFAQNVVTVSLNEGKHTISRHIYGHFAEHLGRCVYEKSGSIGR